MAIMKSEEEMRRIREAEKKAFVEKMAAATAALNAFAADTTPIDEETREWLLNTLLNTATAELRLRIIGQLITIPCDHRGDRRRRY